MLTLKPLNFLPLSLVEHTHASRGRKAEALAHQSPYETIKQYIRSFHIDINQLFEKSPMGFMFETVRKTAKTWSLF